jgi:hypothetical protein
LASGSAASRPPPGRSRITCRWAGPSSRHSRRADRYGRRSDG